MVPHQVLAVTLILLQPGRTDYAHQTEAAIFTIGQSRIIGYGEIRPLADYRSRSRLLNFKRYVYIGLCNAIKSFDSFLTKPYENFSLN